MKRLLALALIFVLVLSLCACGGEPEETTAATTTEPTVETTTEEPTTTEAVILYTHPLTGELSEELWAPEKPRSLRLLGFLTVLLLIAAALGWLVLKERGLLP